MYVQSRTYSLIDNSKVFHSARYVVCVPDVDSQRCRVVCRNACVVDRPFRGDTKKISKNDPRRFARLMLIQIIDRFVLFCWWSA